MKYLGKITDNKDLVTKEYVDAYHTPITTKTFTGVIASANSDPAGWLYFGWVKREGYEVPWRIRYKIYGTIAGLSANYKSYYEVEIRGNYNTYYTFDCFNVCNGSYRAIYDHILFCATSAGISNGYGPLLGVRLQSAYNPATTANSRTFQIDILEVEGCEFVFYDSMKLYANVPGTGTTNYVNRYGLNAHDAGHKMYGDANDTTTLHYSTSRPTAGSNGIPGYSIIMMKPDGTFEGLTVGNATTATTSTKNTSGFVLGQMYLYWASTNLSSGSIAANYTIQTAQDWVDLRYTTNCGTTLTANKMIYLKGTVSNGLFYLADTWWTQTLPTGKDGYVYIPVGYCYGNGYKFCFWGWHGAYYHNGTTLVEYNASEQIDHNIAPLFSYTPYDVDGEYWQPTADKSYRREYFTPLENGWVHINMPSASTAMKEFVPPRDETLHAGDVITFLCEWRNVEANPGANFYTRNYPNNVQCNNNVYFGPHITEGSGEYRWNMTVNSTADGSQEWNGLVILTFPTTSSGTFIGDIRISIYKGYYYGPYIPVSDFEYFSTKSFVYPHILSKCKNLTTKGNLGWTSNTADKIPITNNTLAYWNGRYNGSASNLEYCAKGAFGNLAIKNSLSKSDVGLGNVDNTADAQKQVAYAQNAGTIEGAKIDGVNFDGSEDIVHYTTCAVTSATATASCASFSLTTGSWIVIKFTGTGATATTALTLNINGTGAKNVKYFNSDNAIPANAYIFKGDRVYMLVYDGSCYRLVGDIDTDTTYTISASGSTLTLTDSDGNTQTATISGGSTSAVTGVKGNSESSYRTGQVNLTPANIGAIATSARAAANGVASLDANKRIPVAQLSADALTVGGESGGNLTVQSGDGSIDVDLVETGRTINGKSLSSNITLTAADVGALSTMTAGAITSKSQSISSSTSYSTIQSVSLTAGLYFFQVTASFPTSGTAQRRGGLRIVNGTSTTAISGLEQKLTLSTNGEVVAQVSGWVQPTSTTTYNFQVFQNSGAALTVAFEGRYHKLG